MPQDTPPPSQPPSPPPPSRPGRQLLAAFERIYLLNPSVVNRNDWRYWRGYIGVVTSIALVMVMIFMGYFSPKLAIKMGNYLALHGVPGQIISLCCGFIVLLFLHTRL